MRKFINVLLCLSMVLLLFGCSASQSEAPAQKPENTAVEGPASFYETKTTEYGYIDMYNNLSARKAYTKYREFASRYLQNAASVNENEILSPLSLYYVLAILSNGASGNTRAQIENALGVCTEDLNAFLKDVNQMDLGGYEKMYSMSNTLWFNTAKGLSLKQDFVDTINEYYGSGAEEYDFGDASGLVQKANDWAKQNTDGSIDHILDENDVDDSTMFLLLNALAAGSEWAYQFDSADTLYQEFNCYDRQVNVTEMMHQEFGGYWHLDNCEGFEKYLDCGLTFVAMLPNGNTDIYDFVSSLNGDTLKDFFESYTEWENETNDDKGCSADYHITKLAFPKFKYEKEYELRTALSRMGLEDIFNYQTADFSAMAQGDESLISLLELKEVKQKCSIEVNEEKVEAAAVTAAIGGLGAGGCDVRDYIYHEITFDRPFVFFIVENGRDLTMPLFMGIVTKLGEPVEKAMLIENITGKINIRSMPSTKGEKLGSFAKGETYYCLEKQENEGYTWYRIGENRWVADKNGEWIKEIAH